MKTKKCAITMGIGFLLFMLPGALRADTIPISGTITAANSLVLTSSPNIYSGTSAGTGIDTTFSAFAFSAAETVMVLDPTEFLVSNGTFLETLAGGTLSGTFTGSGTINTSTEETTFVENFVFTNGTGVFAGDTGQATLSGTGVFALSGPSASSYTGTLTTPEPSTLALLCAGLLGLVGMGVRKKQLA